MNPLNIIATILIALAISSPTHTHARPIDTGLTYTEPRPLVTRLNLDDNATNCWGSLFKLQACTGEVINFFYNGETYLGSECCNAVDTIVHDCWPSMLNSLGFTPEEGDLLRVYCEAQAQYEPGPPHGFVTTKDVMVVEKNN